MLIALVIILLTFFQDSKSDSVGGAFGGGGSNSLFGATGATTLVQKMTWYLALGFAVSSISLAYVSSRHSKSILDTNAVPQAPVSAPVAAPATAAPAEPAPASPVTDATPQK